ncbi:MAG: hypothetical protein M3083_25810 [Actinomycetota bacterium]|nr:hypothetical protein [Actinomycetota bacterium]
MRRIALSALCLVVLVACGSGGSAPKATTTVPPPTITTTTVPSAAVEVRPPSGPIGTSFQLLGSRFQSGEKVTFQITFPDTKTFKGPAHPAAADGTVIASFRVTTGNPAGTYQVTASGDKGTQATGQFQVTPGAITATTVAGHITTTVAAHATTTKKP